MLIVLCYIWFEILIIEYKSWKQFSVHNLNLNYVIIHFNKKKYMAISTNQFLNILNFLCAMIFLNLELNSLLLLHKMYTLLVIRKKKMFSIRLRNKFFFFKFASCWHTSWINQYYLSFDNIGYISEGTSLSKCSVLFMCMYEHVYVWTFLTEDFHLKDALSAEDILRQYNSVQ